MSHLAWSSGSFRRSSGPSAVHQSLCHRAMRHPERVNDADEPQPETQEERAVRSLQAIFGGADLTGEAMQVANEFTDQQSGRFVGWVRRLTGGAGKS